MITLFFTGMMLLGKMEKNYDNQHNQKNPNVLCNIIVMVGDDDGNGCFTYKYKEDNGEVVQHIEVFQNGKF